MRLLTKSWVVRVLKTERLWIILIVAINLFLSGAYLHELYESGLVDLNFQEGLDSLTYHLRGVSIAEGGLHWITVGHALYNAIVGVIYSVFGIKPLWIFIFQILLCSLGCILLYVLGKKIFNPFVGLLAAAIYAIYPVSIYYTGIIARVNVVAFLSLLMVYILTLCLEKKGLLRYAMAVVVCSLAVSGRYNILLFIVAFAFWFLFFRHNLLKRNSFVPTVLTGLGFLLATLGLAFWVQLPDLFNLKPWVIGNSYDSNMFYCSPHKELIPVVSKDFLLRQIYKAFAFFNTFEAPNNFNYYLFREKVRLLQYLPISFGVIFPFAMVGFVSAFKNKKNIMPVALFVCFYSISIIIFFIASRYRQPIVPFMILMMSYGIYDIYTNLREKRHKRVVSQMAFLMLMTLLSTWKPDCIKNVETACNAIHRVNFGNLYKRNGEHLKAIQEFKRAIETTPTYWAAYHNLGALYAKQGMYKEALDTYRVVIQEAKDYQAADAYFNIGNLFRRLKQYGKAIQAYQKALEINPQDACIYTNLGGVWMNLEMYDDAEVALKKAVRLNPRAAEAYLNLGSLYSRDPLKKKEAIANYRCYLVLKPDTPLREKVLERIKKLQSNVKDQG
ncbi:MAG: tetratricopeptide repeat protein [Deltaproteobacteria bacterium]|nr:tetratricopeptide repeat protein [Deltaproteobacteria bacterium]MBW2074514.1 tetratricopeptide repeat protein [Deltaproteobacteria bacterium]